APLRRVGPGGGRGAARRARPRPSLPRRRAGGRSGRRGPPHAGRHARRRRRPRHPGPGRPAVGDRLPRPRLRPALHRSVRPAFLTRAGPRPTVRGMKRRRPTRLTAIVLLPLVLTGCGAFGDTDDDGTAGSTTAPGTAAAPPPDSGVGSSGGG